MTSLIVNITLQLYSSNSVNSRHIWIISELSMKRWNAWKEQQLFNSRRMRNLSSKRAQIDAALASPANPASNFPHFSCIRFWRSYESISSERSKWLSLDKHTKTIHASPLQCPDQVTASLAFGLVELIIDIIKLYHCSSWQIIRFVQHSPVQIEI